MIYILLMLERIHHDIFSQETETDDDKGRFSEMPSQGLELGKCGKPLTGTIFSNLPNLESDCSGHSYFE